MTQEGLDAVELGRQQGNDSVVSHGWVVKGWKKSTLPQLSRRLAKLLRPLPECTSERELGPMPAEVMMSSIAEEVELRVVCCAPSIDLREHGSLHWNENDREWELESQLQLVRPN
jgi:hypothetical protein